MLYKAQFQKSFFRCCYLRHILRKAVFSFFPLLRSAQFFRMQGAVVIGSTIPVCRIFSSGVVKRSTFFAERLFRTGIVTENTIQKNSKKFFFRVVIPDTFQKSHPKLRPQNFCAKNIFLRCYRRHIVAQHTARLLDNAQQGWNPPHSFVVIFDIAIPYF